MPSLLSVYTHWGGEPRPNCIIYSLILFIVVILGSIYSQYSVYTHWGVVILDLQAILPARVAYIIGPYSTQTLFKTGRLFQQYTVDAWATAEQYRLKWFQHHQSDLCAETLCTVNTISKFQVLCTRVGGIYMPLDICICIQISVDNGD